MIDIVLEGDEISLPAGLGSFEITGTKKEPKFDKDGKITNLQVDWGRTKKLKQEGKLEEKKVVYYTNIETDQIVYKYTWHKNKTTILNKNLYSLTMTRKNKRTLGSLIKNGKRYRNEIRKRIHNNK